MAEQPVSFQNDIMPVFKQFQAEMAWRLDLTNYDQVKANYKLILGQVATRSMPPPPFPPLSDQQIAQFIAWGNQGFPQ